MTPRSIPLRIRAAVTVVIVLGVLVVAGATVVVQYGASALHATDGSEASASATGRTWFGLELENPSAVPVTLRSVRAVLGSNARIAEIRVFDRRSGGDGIGVMSPPLPAATQAVVDAARPVEGFVIPAHSRNRFQLLVLLERIEPRKAAVLRETDIRFTALGLDHGFRSHAVVCIRAPGAADCPAA